MRTNNTSIAPVLAASILTGGATAVIRRMEDEYAGRDTLSSSTVAAMYALYAAYTATLVWGARQRIWAVPLPARPTRTIGTGLVVTGAGIALAGARPFGAGAQISGIEPGTLHATGIYHYSRNPQYLGLGLAATGVAIAARSAFAGLGASGVWLAYRRWIPSEERHLTRTFGQAYTTYQRRVRRWLGRAT